MSARLAVLPLLGVVLVLAAGCGGGGSSASETETTTTTEGSAQATTLDLAADPGGALKFDKDTLEAPAGSVTIQLTNDSSVPHNIAVEGGGVDAESETVSGGTTSVTADLQPGTYTFYCAVPGHREGGMEGTLTVS